MPSCFNHCQVDSLHLTAARHTDAFWQQMQSLLVKSLRILLWHMFCSVRFCFWGWAGFASAFCQSSGSVPRNDKGREGFRAYSRAGLPCRNPSLPRTWHLSDCAWRLKSVQPAGLVHWLYEREWCWGDTGRDIFMQRGSEHSGERCSSCKDHSVNEVALWIHRHRSAQYFHLHSAEDFRGFCESFISVELI